MTAAISIPESLYDAELAVLVVEDNEQDFFLLKHQLRQSRNLSLSHALSVKQGLAALTEKDFNLVLLDLSLPDSNGLNTVSQIVSKSSAPVLVLTGTDDEQTGLEAMHEGAQDYLVKGMFDATLLIRSIRYAVERYKLLDKLNETQDMVRRERELRRLKIMSWQEGSTGTACNFDQKRPLKERNNKMYSHAVVTYAGILDSAVEQRGFKVDNNIPTRLKDLAELLGSYQTAPADIVAIHSSMLSAKLDGLESGKSRICNEESRYLLTGVLGHLCSFYSRHCTVLPEPAMPISEAASNDSEIELE